VNQYVFVQKGELKVAFADADLARLLLGLAVLLVAAHCGGALFSRFRQPAAIGEIAAGALLGPTLLAALFPAAEHWLFPASGSSSAALGAVYQLGVLFLMFAAGTQMRQLVQRDAVRSVGSIATLGLVVPFAAAIAMVPVFGADRFVGTAGNRTALTLTFGLAIAVTSIPVISRIMHDLGLLGTRFSRIVLSVAVIEDIVVYVLLAVTVGLVETDRNAAFGLPTVLHMRGVYRGGAYHAVAAVGFLVLCLRFGGGVYRRFAATAGRLTGSKVAVQLVWMLSLSAAALALGLIPLYGAFVAGIAVASTNRTLTVSDGNALAPMSFGFFIPIYFALIGLSLDLIHHFDPLFFLGFLAFACAAKTVSVYLGARLARETPNMARNLAVAMNARGGPGIVLASTTYAAGIINKTFFVTLVMLSVVTSLLAGTWLERAAPGLGGTGKRRRLARPAEEEANLVSP
jgi:Kef-type K+ transport system membrane component KefB